MKKLVLLSLVSILITKVTVSQPITFDWAYSLAGKTSIEGAISLAKDGSGNVYVTGEFTGSRDFGGITLTALGFSDVFVAKYSSLGICQWAINAGGGFSSAYGGELIVQGNDVIVTGYFTNIMTIGTGSCGVFATGYKDVFIASLDATSGNCNWLEKAGSSYDDLGISITGLASGGFVIAGTYTDTAYFGPHTLISSSIIDADVFVAKYSSTGSCQWAKRFGNTSADMVNCVRELPGGFLGITGSYENTLVFAPGITLVSTGFADILLAKLDNNGNAVWAVSAGGANTDIGQALSFDPSGNIYFTGFIADTADFGSIHVNNPFNIEFFVSKYSSSGVAQWVKIGGNTLDDIGYDIVTDASGSSYVTGYMNGNGIFAGTSVLGIQAQDGIIAKFDHLGTLRWVTKVGGQSLDRGKAIVLDVGGEFITAGEYADYALFGSAGLVTDPGVWGIYLTRMGGGTVSVGEVNPVKFNMFPNPANESVYLDLSQITDLAFTLDLFAMDGKLVLSRKINQQESLKNYNIPLANLPSGIYTVKVSSSLGEFSRQLTVN